MFVRIIFVVALVLVAWSVFARASVGASPERSYVVRQGDTLWGIAAREYGGDPRKGVWLIRERNGLTDSALRTGQRLRLP